MTVKGLTDQSIRGIRVRENELDFFRRRASEERERAEHSLDAVAADIHRRMAIAYTNRAAEIEQARAFELVQPPLPDQDSTSSR